MDPFPNSYTDLGNSENYHNNQYYENSSFFPNPSQLPFTQNPQTSQNTEKQTKTAKWEAAEDVALMSAYCIASVDSIHGKNKKKPSLWAEVKKMYDAAQAENPEQLGERNVDQMKGRFSRLNETVGKWVAAYREAYRRATSGTSQKDIESDAHKIYEQSGKKFNDYIVYNKVMCKYPKWALELPRGTTRHRPESEAGDEESDGSTKRTMTSEEGDYYVNSNQESPVSGGSSIQRPMGRDEAKKKRKEKVRFQMKLLKNFVE
ncbi:glutathione S-transferase T2-like [Bidens hawaiensis]|uniref:glutathione S-transferase T2-like n=1 Tax=Bidens hawaiensis TaxID=980011 RepID=UPI00404AA1B3